VAPSSTGNSSPSSWRSSIHSAHITNPLEHTPEMEAADQIGELRKMVLNPAPPPEATQAFATRTGKKSEATRMEDKTYAYCQKIDKIAARRARAASRSTRAKAPHEGVAAHRPEPPPGAGAQGPQSEHPHEVRRRQGGASEAKHGAVSVSTREVPKETVPGKVETTWAGKPTHDAAVREAGSWLRPSASSTRARA
jgi:hypothetical protein